MVTAPLLQEVLAMRIWLQNVRLAISTIAAGMYVTLWTMVQSFRRGTFTAHFAYPEQPIPIRPRYRGFHRYDLTTCIGCDNCIYIDKEKNPAGKGFLITGFKIDYTKCMFCSLCVDPCPVDCIFMGSTHDLSTFTRDNCVVDYAKLPLDVAWGQSTLTPTAVYESKKVALPVWVKPPDPPKPVTGTPPTTTGETKS
jgi:NADH-quinone oxidoreductase subunit I